MRVSADLGSDYYKGDESYEVWLDGKRLTHVIEADEENGWVIVHSDVGSTYRKILRGRVTILNPRLLPVVVPRKLTVLLMQGAVPSKFTRMLVAHWQACGHVAELVEVGPELNGYTPEGVWMDDLEAEWSIRSRAMLEETERLFLYGDGKGNPSRGILDSRSGTVEFILDGKEFPRELFEPALKQPKWPKSYRVQHERAWQIKKRKGRS